MSRFALRFGLGFALSLRALAAPAVARDFGDEFALRSAKHGDVALSLSGPDVGSFDESSALVVVHTGDGGLGSLRQAIEDANAVPGADAIIFDVPAELCDANGVCTITVATPLPSIADAVTIDGTTQPRFATAPANVCATAEAPSFMRIAVQSTTGSVFDVQSSGPVTLRGLSIGSTALDSDGIAIRSAGPHRVQCSHVNADPTGVGVPAGRTGVSIRAPAHGAIVGTDGDGVGDRGEGNVFGSGQVGVSIVASDANAVAGNAFGVTADGSTLLGCDFGVLLANDSDGNWIGADGDGVSEDLETNVFAGCNAAVWIDPRSTVDPNVVAGNRIGFAGVKSPYGLYVFSAASFGEGSVVVRDNVFTNNDSAVLLLGPVRLAAGSERNCVDGNDIGLDVQGAFSSIAFENNWWGDPSGPSGEGLAGTGDLVLGSANVVPFATDGCRAVPEPGAALLGACALLAIRCLRTDRRSRRN